MRKILFLKKKVLILSKISYNNVDNMLKKKLPSPKSISAVFSCIFCKSQNIFLKNISSYYVENENTAFYLSQCFL